MRAVVQRVSEARVTVQHRVVAEIGTGLLVLLGIASGDGSEQVTWAADKLAHLRVFSDDRGKMNRSLIEVSGAALIVSQFTLYGDARAGRRPSFVRAARGDEAERLYTAVISRLRTVGVEVAAGRFGAMMDVTLTNEGPVTILLDSDRAF
ncbi:MAG: D-aminoacyl-tRNA deacylase [Actinomycetota bacterium]|nr:D-aminoacyl-tRNA deacylase [Actinomycetota bacterium]